MFELRVDGLAVFQQEQSRGKVLLYRQTELEAHVPVSERCLGDLSETSQRTARFHLHLASWLLTCSKFPHFNLSHVRIS